MTEKEIVRVCIFGPPCAGKTSVTKLLANKFALSHPVDAKTQYITFPEAWVFFEPFALKVLENLEQSCDQIQKILLSFMQSSLAVDHLANPTLQVLKRSQKFECANLESVTLLDLYKFFGLTFINDLHNESFSVEKTFMTELMRIQLNMERKLIKQDSFSGTTVAVFDGGVLYPVLYPVQLKQTNYTETGHLLQPIFKQFDLWLPHFFDMGAYYDVVILLETLAVLRPSEYQAHYYSGPRQRLATPSHARSMQTLMEKFYFTSLHQRPYEHKFFYKARLPLMDKVETIFEMLTRQQPWQYPWYAR